MKEIFEKAGIDVTRENKKEIDKLIHSIVGVEYKNCSEAWKAVKEHITDKEESFIEALRV